MQSAIAYVRGLFYSERVNSNNPNPSFTPLNFPLVPIYNFEKHEHKFRLHDLSFISDCTVIDRIREQYKNDEKSNEIVRDFKREFGRKIEWFLAEETDRNLGNFESFMNYNFVHNFCDNFIADYTEGLDLSVLIQYSINLQRLKSFCDLALRHVISHIINGDKNVVMMSMTRPMKQLIEYMEGRISLDKENKSDFLAYGKPKYVVWSLHDTSISTMMNWMRNLFGTEWVNPIYASTLTFELHKISSEYIVKYYFNHKILLEISFDSFKKSNENAFWSEEKIDEFCQYEILTRKSMEKISEKMKNYRAFCVVLSVLLILSVLCHMWSCWKKQEKKKNEEELRDMDERL